MFENDDIDLSEKNNPTQINTKPQRAETYTQAKKTIKVKIQTM
jgi:hypothetical protein